MPFVVWDKKYSVNVKQIDDQHQKLVGLINELYDAMLAGQGQPKLRTILASSVDYTKQHFLTEENLFALHGYPAGAEHKAEHVAFLMNWLLNHIQSTDKKYSGFLNELKQWVVSGRRQEFVRRESAEDFKNLALNRLLAGKIAKKITAKRARHR